MQVQVKSQVIDSKSKVNAGSCKFECKSQHILESSQVKSQIFTLALWVKID